MTLLALIFSATTQGLLAAGSWVVTSRANAMGDAPGARIGDAVSLALAVGAALCALAIWGGAQ